MSAARSSRFARGETSTDRRALEKEMGFLGKSWLFVCSRSGYKATRDKIEQSFGDLDSKRH